MRPIFSSDIGHWDVAHMDEVLPEAYEHLEHGWMDKDQFRDFMCDNAVRLFRGANPDYFKGSTVETYAASVNLDPSCPPPSDPASRRRRPPIPERRRPF